MEWTSTDADIQRDLDTMRRQSISDAGVVLYDRYQYSGADLKRHIESLHQSMPSLEDETLARFAVEQWLGIDHLSDLVEAWRRGPDENGDV